MKLPDSNKPVSGITGAVQPPGIAKRFDGSLAGHLPRYPGYEWERVGADVVLIEAATRVVVDILVGALR